MAIIALTIFSTIRSVAQEGKVYTTATVMPSYPGGKDALAKFLKTNVKYPAAADSAKIKGSITVSFIVEKTGALTSLDVTNTIGHGCDEEGLRVVRKMPKWNPGTIGGKPVRVAYKLVIKFPQ